MVHFRGHHPAAFQVVVGSHTYHQYTRWENECSNSRPTFLNDIEQVLGIEEYIIHYNWNRESLDKDIALLKLTYPVNWTDTIRPICLSRYESEPYTSSEGDELDSTNCVISGWGNTWYLGKLTFLL